MVVYMKKILAVAALSALLPFSANAGGMKPENPWTDCGIGALVFPKEKHEVAAAISNIIWDLGTTAVTSAVSTPHTCNAQKLKTATLIGETLPELEKDLASGNGEYVVALGDAVGCDAAVRGDIVAKTRESYAERVSGAEYSKQSRAERAEALYDSVKKAVESTPEGCENVVL